MMPEDEESSITQLKLHLEEAQAIIKEKDEIIHRLEEENKRLKF